ncbi:MAG: transporter substrate-binding domain-containing protein [Gammaproteobacteria bacterium]|nr:transporter substrate-binding domain-containing protein [Gammaproteobacteria bacterium]
MYQDVDGSIRGLDIELISASAAKVGCEVTFNKASWTELLERLRNGEVDVVAGASPTEARNSYAWYSNPYRREAFALYVRATESPKYPSTLMPELLDMGMSVGVVSDYVYGEEISGLQESKEYADQFMYVPIGELNYLSLLDYKIDGFLEDPFVAATVLRKKGLDQDIEKHPLVIDSGGVHFMFSKASVSEDTVKRINKGMSELIADGAYQAILDKYSQ